MTVEEKAIMKYFSGITDEGLEFAKNYLLAKIGSNAASIQDFYENESSEYTLTCPYCNSSKVKKNGNWTKINYEPARNEVLYRTTKKKLNQIDRNYLKKNFLPKDIKKTIVQRFFCNECRHSFTHNTNTITQYSKLSLEILDVYLTSMLNNDILVESASKCNLSVYTCFVLRHKILSMLVLNNEGLMLCGDKIEMDETYFKVSYKGNRTHIKPNIKPYLQMINKPDTVMKRKAHKRGKSDPNILVALGYDVDPVKQEKELRGISKNKICVVTGLDHNGNYIGMVSNRGRPSIDSLHRVLDGHIVEGSTMYTDEMNAYVQFAQDNKIHLIQQNSKVKIKGQDTLQSINSFHNVLKHKISDIHFGISGKYLNNYVAWFVYVLKKDGKLHDNLEGFRTMVFHTRRVMRRKDVSARPNISFDQPQSNTQLNRYVARLVEQALNA